jgi:CBS domain-containing protein/mannitol/fructose-specific phosphotransferase system IIA component (Ntr-type)
VRLGELLDPRCIRVPLGAHSVREGTRQLATALAAAGLADDAAFASLLEDEWPEDVVTAPGRAFLPHFRTDAVRKVAVALGVTPRPVCLAGDPARCARVIVLVAAPTNAASAYLRAMRAVAQALSQDETLEGLHAATTPEAVLALPGISDAPVPDEVTVRDLMTQDVVFVGPDDTLREAAHVMRERRVGAVPVAGGAGEVVGLLTDGHLLRYLLPETVSALSTGRVRTARRRTKGGTAAAPGEEKVRDVMDRSVMCLEEDQTIADVAALMIAKSVDKFPVTRDGALVGFLTRSDIVRKLLKP